MINSAAPLGATLECFNPEKIPNYAVNHVQITQILSCVKNIFDQAQHSIATNNDSNLNYEIEMRFGQLCFNVDNIHNPYKFNPNVSGNVFFQALKYIKTFPGWNSTHEWTQSHDFYYEHNNTLHRTSTVFELGQLKPRITHMIKHPQEKRDFKWNCLDPQFIGMPYDIRLSYSIEEKITEQDLPQLINPNYVRIKLRTSFEYKPKYSEKPLFTFDFTKSWSGQTYADAEEKQRRSLDSIDPINDETIYEIEIECINLKHYFEVITKEDVRRDSWFLATSLLLKCADLIPSQNFEWGFP